MARTLVNTISSGLNTSHLHLADDFPLSSTIYGWHINGLSDFDDGDWTTSGATKALTENGAISSIILGQSVLDRLGLDTFCYFDGTNDYLSSTDIVFDSMTGSFSLCGWFRADDWTPATEMILISKTNTTNGWSLALRTDGSLYAYNHTGTATEADTISNSGLTSGWHHIAYVRDDGTSSAIYIDGKVMSYTNSHADITDAGDLEIGSYNSGTSKFQGAIQNIVVDTSVAWSANEVRKIYSAQCGNFITQEKNSNKIVIHDGRKVNGLIRANLTATYQCTTSWANVPGLSVYVPEDGFYRISYKIDTDADGADRSGQSVFTRLYDGTNALLGTASRVGPHNIYSVSGTLGMISVETFVHLSKDTNITVQAKEVQTGEVQFSSGDREGYLILEKLD